MRVVSTALAPMTTTLPYTVAPCPSCGRSTARPRQGRRSSTSTRATTAFDRSSSRPVFEGEGQQVIGRVEERGRVAALAAVAAVVARGEAAHRLRHIGAPAGHDRDVHLPERLLQQPLAAPGRRRRQQELAPRQRVGIVGAAADADQLFDLVVVRRDVRVADRPRDLPSVVRRALEVEIGVAEAHAAPDVRLAAMTPDANQLERLVGRRQVRLLLRVEEELRRLLALGRALAPLPRLHVRPERAAIELGSRHRASAR